MVRSVVVALASLVTAVALAPTVSTMSAEALVVLATLAAATTVMGVHGPAAVPDAAMRLLLPRRRAADVPLVLPGRTTDVVHPVRPRAPGRV